MNNQGFTTLVTDEELEVLKLYKFDILEKDENTINFYDLFHDIAITRNSIDLAHFKYKFEGLEDEANYTKKELGL